MARTSSLNCLPVEILTNPLIRRLPPPLALKTPFFTEKCFVRSPAQKGVRLFWYRAVFFTVSRWPKSPFWYRDLFFGIEILHSVVQHLDRLLARINQCLLFWASTSCRLEVKEDLDTEKKIRKSRYPKKDISIPTKRVTRPKIGSFRTFARFKCRENLVCQRFLIAWKSCIWGLKKFGQPASVT